MQTFLDSNRKRRVLIVDDEEVNREILGAILSSSYELCFAENGLAALNILSDPHVDFSLVLLDLKMPVMDGFEVIEHIRADERLCMFPIIVMTADKSAEVRCLRMGASDFISKPFDMPEVILARCGRVIELNEDRSLIRSTERDPLTGLYTRDFFFVYIRRLMKNIDADMDALAINIDRFHLINELFGRPEGDLILQKTAELINRGILDSHGIACRTEGDCFYIYCEHRNDYSDRLKAIEKELAAKTQAHSLKLRAGVLEHVTSDIMPESWFDRAKAVSDSIRDRFDTHVAFYSPEIYKRSVYDERLIGDIDRAIENRELSVYYQPKYNIRGSRPVLASAEALVRWNHPELGMISPGAFIPLFERNGLIRKVDRFVWNEAAAQIRRWKDDIGFSPAVSVNVSRLEFFDNEPDETLSRIINKYNLSYSELMPEITESAFSDDENRQAELIGRLRSKGFIIEMDDFGTGYSSLNMLTTVSIDVLKLDMIFVRNMLQDKKSLLMIKLVLDIARFLDVPVVAEGVENEEQLIMLKEMGCDIIQGYYFSPPIPAEEFTRLIYRGLENARAE